MNWIPPVKKLAILSNKACLKTKTPKVGRIPPKNFYKTLRSPKILPQHCNIFTQIYLPHLWHFATLPFVYLLVTNLLIWRTITKDTASSHQTNIGEKLTLRAHRVSPASTSGFATPPPFSNSSEILSFQKSFSKMHCNMMSSLLTVLLDFHIFFCRTSLLIAIVVIYMVCNIPRLLLNLTEYLNQVLGDAEMLHQSWKRTLLRNIMLTCGTEPPSRF